MTLRNRESSNFQGFPQCWSSSRRGRGRKTPFAPSLSVTILSSEVSQISTFPKFMEELIMPFKRAQVPSQREILSLAEDWGKVVAHRAWRRGTGPGPQLRRHRSGCLPGSSSRHQGNHPAILEPADAETRGDPVVPAMPTSLSRGDRTTGTRRTRRHGAVRRAEVPLPDMSSGFFSLSVPRCDLTGMASAHRSSGRS